MAVLLASRQRPAAVRRAKCRGAAFAPRRLRAQPV